MSSKLTFASGKILFTLIALFTAISPYVADWNATHLFNPLWPPHAKFHNAQTMTVGLLLGVAALLFIWIRRGGVRANLLSVIIFVSLYWVSQILVNLYPGVAWTDPNLLEPGESLSHFPTPQFIVDLVMFALIALAALLVLRGSADTQNESRNEPQARGEVKA